MPRIWIGGKPVEVTKEELPEYLPMADAVVPGASAPATQPIQAGGGAAPRAAQAPVNGATSAVRDAKLMGLYAALDENSQKVLTHLAANHPNTVTAEDLEKAVGVADLRGIMSHLSRRAGKGRAVRRKMDYSGGGRTIIYSIANRMLRIGKREGWVK